MITRRRLLAGGLLLLVWPRPVRAGTPAPPTPGLVGPDGQVAASLVPVLEQARFAYVSPLHKDGSQSTCHGEVWFAWLDGAVCTTSRTETWKVRGLGKGLDRARIWLGDYGRWKHPGGMNEGFRRGPNFVARAERVRDKALLERILAAYDGKYADQIGRWRKRMSDEVASGERVILRYRPIPG